MFDNVARIDRHLMARQIAYVFSNQTCKMYNAAYYKDDIDGELHCDVSIITPEGKETQPENNN